MSPPTSGPVGSASPTSVHSLLLRALRPWCNCPSPPLAVLRTRNSLTESTRSDDRRKRASPQAHGTHLKSRVYADIAHSSASRECRSCAGIFRRRPSCFAPTLVSTGATW